jgi:hypothetical protein
MYNMQVPRTHAGGVMAHPDWICGAMVRKYINCGKLAAAFWTARSVREALIRGEAIGGTAPPPGL